MSLASRYEILDGEGKELGKKFLNCLGTNYGAYPEILKQKGDYFLCKVPGTTQWCAVGNSRYYGPSLYIFKKVDTDRGPMVDEVKEFEYNRKTKKQVSIEAEKYFEEVSQ